MKNVFVIGGAGFVGSHLVARLLADRNVERVVVYDNLSSGRATMLPAPSDRVSLVVGNARDFDFLRMAIAKFTPDLVFHLAANPDIARAVTEPTIDFEQGTLLTKNVVEAMRVNEVKRLVYFSGSGVYGDYADIPLRESHPCSPISTYGASKLASEAMILAYCAMFGLSAKIFRPANIVGPRQTHGVGYDFLRKLKADSTKLAILGDGRQSKSYIHVDDVIDAVLLTLQTTAVSKVYNLATDDYLSVAEIATMATELVLGDMPQVKLEYSGGNRGWKGDVPIVRFDCRGIKSCGWKSKRTSKEAMRDSLAAMWSEISDV